MVPGRGGGETGGVFVTESYAAAMASRSATDDGCVFCRIGKDLDDASVVFRDDHVVAFLDRAPLFAGHVLVAPLDHVVTLADLPATEVGPFWRRVQHISRMIPSLLGAEGTFVANNNVVSQSVAHLHVHVVPRRRGDGLRGFFWPRTRYEPGEAEAVAGVLRAGLDSFTEF
jgi:histidine triad (HIT) family protein